MVPNSEACSIAMLTAITSLLIAVCILLVLPFPLRQFCCPLIFFLTLFLHALYVLYNFDMFNPFLVTIDHLVLFRSCNHFMFNIS